jgi:GT2 family glycosyltransferase
VSAVDDQPIDVDDAELVAPPVVAVVITHDPGPWFDEVLAGLRAQDYTALSVLVIDAGSEVDPTDRVAAVLPDAYVRRLGANPGFGAAANEVLTIVEGAAFHLLCHDDVVLAPDAVSALVQEAYRSNAGIVGPKLVQWDDPTRLRQVGVQVDKSGHEVANVEPGELDQEQHDAVRDVFCVPGAATLVRADLFSTLGGYDPAITFLGEDIDLCWRAQVAGARVLVVPAAVGRHREAFGERTGLGKEERRRLVLRHRLRSVLVNYSRLHRWRVVPQVALLAVAEFVYATLAGRRPLAAAIAESWRWNRSHRDDIKAARARLEAVRTVPDSEVRRLQARGSARFALFVRGQVGGGDDRVKTFTRSAGDIAGSLRRGPTRTSVAVWALLVLTILFGSRHHLWGSTPSLVDLPQLPSRPWPLLAEWLSGWRRAGLGSEAPQPTAYGLLGTAGTLLLGSMTMLRRLLVLVPLLLGPIGAARLVRPTGSRRAPWVAALTYAAIPLPYDALATGRWTGLLAWSLTPWILGGLLRSSGDEPFRPARAATPPWWSAPLTVGLATAVLAAALPLAALLPLGLALVLVVSGFAVGRGAGAGRILRTGLGATLVAVVLHLPWALDFVLPGTTWASIGGAATDTAAPGMGELLRFELGPIGAAPLGFVFLAAAALPLVIGRSWRLRWAARCWVLAAVGWGATVAAGADAVEVALGPPELLLAPAAAGLAVATALGMVAFEVDLPGYRFGWRQVASAVAALAVGLGTLPVLGGAFNGSWSAPRDGIDEVLGFLDLEQADGAFRTLWIGDPAVLPLGGWQLDDGVAWGLTDRGVPNVIDRWTGSPDGTTSLVADGLSLARGRETARLGRLLAPMGIRYVVVVEADRPIDGPQAPAPPDLVEALAEQLDLAEVRIDEGTRVFRNAAWFSTRSVLDDVDDAAAPGGPLAAAGRSDLADDAAPALPDIDGVTDFRGPVEEGDVVWHAAAAADGWALTVDGEAAARADGFGFGTTYAAPSDGTAELRYSTPVYRLLLSGLQAAAWVVAVRTAWRLRRRLRQAEAEVPA